MSDIKIKNIKMLDEIHAVVLKHSNNRELADAVWESLISKGFKGVVAPPSGEAEALEGKP
jgi:hypothetical protein